MKVASAKLKFEDSYKKETCHYAYFLQGEWNYKINILFEYTMHK